jgi:uncharacterized Zn finger protein (UPF0148 family)
LALAFFALLVASNLRQSASWDSRSEPSPRRHAPQLDAIRRLDPEFSAVLFQDFVYALYARAHHARSNHEALAALAPYLSARARTALEAFPLPGAPETMPTLAVILGAVHVEQVTVPLPESGGTNVWVVLRIESNVTLGDAGSEKNFYVRETWDLARNVAVRSKPPEAVRSFHCPNCGAPFASSDGDRCAFCGEIVSGGRFDWTVMTIRDVSAEARPPALTGTVEEQGNDLPTVYQPGLVQNRDALLRDDPAITEAALEARLRLIYDQLNLAWTNRDLTPVRPYVSDSLYNYLQYWIDAYERQDLRNVLQNMRILQAELAKVVRDRWFSAVTFRIRATGRDTTVRVDTGERVGGRPHRDREYTEYWTLIRGVGVRGAPRTDRSCPNCGASLQEAGVNEAGQCAHCGAHITRGEFDWVLSQIEQDDSYTG